MKSRTHFDSIVEFWDRFGSEDAAIAAYVKLHPEEAGDEEELRAIIEMEKRYRSYSIYVLYRAMGRFMDEYSPESAVRDYLEMHPEVNEADVRAELSRALAKEGEIWPAPQPASKR
jgi:hypothetical protein